MYALNRSNKLYLIDKLCFIRFHGNMFGQNTETQVNPRNKIIMADSRNPCPHDSFINPPPPLFPVILISSTPFLPETLTQPQSFLQPHPSLSSADSSTLWHRSTNRSKIFTTRLQGCSYRLSLGGGTCCGPGYNAGLAELQGAMPRPLILFSSGKWVRRLPTLINCHLDWRSKGMNPAQGRTRFISSWREAFNLQSLCGAKNRSNSSNVFFLFLFFCGKQMNESLSYNVHCVIMTLKPQRYIWPFRRWTIEVKQLFVNDSGIIFS